MKRFSAGMYRVSDVQNNINDATELKTMLWNEACKHRAANGSLDYGEPIEISVQEAIDLVHALELLIDQLYSKELKKPGE